MVYQELITYVRDAREKGASDEDIHRALIGAGWGVDDVDVALKVSTRLDERVQSRLDADAAATAAAVAKPVQQPVQPSNEVSLSDLGASQEKPVQEKKSVQPLRPAIFTSKNLQTENSIVSEIKPPEEIVQQTKAQAKLVRTPDDLAWLKQQADAKIAGQPAQPEASDYSSTDVPVFYAHWLKVLLHPADSFKREIYHASLGRSYANILVPYVILLVFAGILATFVASMFGPIEQLIYQLPLSGAAFLLLAPLVGIVYGSFAFLALILVTVPSFIIASALSGRNRFSQQVHAFTVIVPAMLLLSMLFTAFSVLLVQVSVFLPLIFALLLVLYCLVLQAIALKVVYGFGWVKALVSLLLPWVLVIVVLVGIAVWLSSGVFDLSAFASAGVPINTFASPVALASPLPFA